MKKEKGVSHIHAKRVEAYVQDGVEKTVGYTKVYNVQRKPWVWAWKKLYDLRKRKKMCLAFTRKGLKLMFKMVLRKLSYNEVYNV